MREQADEGFGERAALSRFTQKKAPPKRGAVSFRTLPGGIFALAENLNPNVAVMKSAQEGV
jgi:hypothetical protein